jgi:transcription-repair coupling factor (superfamily II helicase)
MRLNRGATIRATDVQEEWVRMGYRKDASVQIPGTFSQRGGILDIFPSNLSLPVRVELFGNKVDILNDFDPLTQRSRNPLETVFISPAVEILPVESDHRLIESCISNMNFTQCSPSVKSRVIEDITEVFSGNTRGQSYVYNGLINTESLLNHVNDRHIVIFDNKTHISLSGNSLDLRNEKLKRDREVRGDIPANFPDPYYKWNKLIKDLENYQQIDLGSLETTASDMGFRSPPELFSRTDNLAHAISGSVKKSSLTIVVTRSPRRIQEILADHSIPNIMDVSPDTLLDKRAVHIIKGSLNQGWRFGSDKNETMLLTDLELFGVKKEPIYKERKQFKKASIPLELQTGNYIVHENHGIARFTGTSNIETNGEMREYIVLEYAENDKLYLPTDQLDLISTYLVNNDNPPRLSRLHTADWSRAKARVKASTQKMAKELLALYAVRQIAQGYSFSKDTVWQQELESSFQFEETPDQARTINEVKQDMELSKPMDRLVCGDVGYGKTEVALRAAFKAATDNKQVAIVVPTTVLAQQHYETFSNRLRPFPLEISVLSRFSTSKQQKELRSRLESGLTDIVIGTHRLLQNDVRFKDLGLVIIDEEQRFGVGHKEKLKGMKKGVDILTLSATPIPRTLYMALSGIRDMSTINTAPENRWPVTTYVGEYNQEMVKSAILAELDRNGKIFFLHNRINSIWGIASELKSLVPQARVGIAHGSMVETDLNSEMLKFTNGDTDILVCTTLIESGLDIPNANTLIVNKADQLGLSQLYQIRGRVGRRNTKAYCYLLVSKKQSISPNANKRLQAILEASDLGSGLRIAMRDLEIRGAGNILGSEQSGQISAVGFELYTRLLKQAITELKNTGETPMAHEPSFLSDIRIDLPVSPHIPKQYISHLPDRLGIYKRLAVLRTQTEIKEMREELKDRFGPIPGQANDLLYTIKIKLIAIDLGIESLSTHGDSIVLTLKHPTAGSRIALSKALGNLASVGHHKITLHTTSMGTDWRTSLLKILASIKRFQESLSKLV